MARQWSDGAEFKDTLFWDVSDSITASATYKRSGTSSYRIGTSGSGSKSTGDLTSGYFRYALYGTTNTPGTTTYIRFRHGTTNLVSISITFTGGKYVDTVTVGSTAVAWGTTSWQGSTWYLYEIYVSIDDSGRVILYRDGVKEIDYSGDTKPGTDTHFDGIYFGNSGSIDYYYDDIAFNDTTGGVDDSWCGDEHYELLAPNADGDVNNWTGSDGDKISNYLLVDEVPQDSDTTYVKATTDVQDMYNVGDYSPTGKIPVRVWAECRAKDNDSSAGAIWVGYKTGGTVYLSSAVRTLTGSYSRIVGDDAKLNPFDGQAWEEADLDAIQFVVEASSSSSSSSTTSSSSSSVIP